jgi:hypothetical protein
MVTLVPEQMLEEVDRVVVVNIHVLACLHPAPYRFPYRPGAMVQHLLQMKTVTLAAPLLVGHGLGEFRSILGNEDKPNVVNVGEHLPDGWAAVHRPGIQTALWESVKQVDEDPVVPTPGVQQHVKQAFK